MNFSGVTRFFGRVALKMRDKSPQLCMIAGGVTFIGTVVVACKEVLAYQEVLEEHNQLIEELKITEEKLKSGELSVAALKKADPKRVRRAIYARTAIKTVKTFAPAVGLGFASLGFFGAAFRIMNVRYAGLGALYMGLKKDHESLQDVIVQEYGEEKLQELKQKQVIETREGHIDKETGEHVVDSVKKHSLRQHSIFFDQGNPYWSKDYDENVRLLETKWNYANYVFRNQGHLFKNELLDIFGYRKDCFTQDGNIVGWKFYKDPLEADRHGAANYIDIGIDFNDISKNSEFVQRFLRGEEPVVELVFNIDPEPILGEIGWATT